MGRTCDACQQLITDIAIRVSSVNKIYHPEHFRCAGCSEILPPACFFIVESKCYCKKCRMNHHTSRQLLKSSTPSDMTTAATPAAAATAATTTPSMGLEPSPFHLCVLCNKRVIAEKLFSLDGEPICGECYAGGKRAAVFSSSQQPARPLSSAAPAARKTAEQSPPSSRNAGASQCEKCGQNITENSWVVALGKCWHKHCLVCTVCRTPLESRFVIKSDLPYCLLHSTNTSNQ